MIPITFNKDDTLNLKKGNIRGQDLASILSFGIPQEAGILNIWQNPVSVTGNVTSTGYATLTLNKGYICIYGRLIYIEQGEQVQVGLPTSEGSVSGTFGIRINLGNTGASEVEWFAKTGDLRKDNILNDEVQGIYELGIYRYTATSSALTLGEKIAPIIYNVQTELANSLSSAKSYTDAKTLDLENNLQTQINSIGTYDILLEGSATGTYNFDLASVVSNYKMLIFQTKANGQDWYSTSTLTGIVNREVFNHGLEMTINVPMDIDVSVSLGFLGSCAFQFKNNGTKMLISRNRVRYFNYFYVIGVK